MGLVTAEEFRKAREAADSLEEAEAKRRQDKEVNRPRVVNDRCWWQLPTALVFDIPGVLVCMQAVLCFLRKRAKGARCTFARVLWI